MFKYRVEPAILAGYELKKATTGGCFALRQKIRDFIGQTQGPDLPGIH